ncbi:hypothetical protein GTZ99_10840 [Novosphingobium sp. FSY-8]|uniref:Uncharacterized protein n=1 Tax=Novosphingobium ovatum TaxID=1908523 RepID=A0ABW9XF39_9SPHN|nr:hypothetical protein [Novosphingobium ovatum]NBC37052.1 hypothetical protein [Novosphingobium ovatum]
MFIPGPRLTTVFASRWKAAFWASTVLLTAYCTAQGAKDKSEAQDAASAASTAQASPWGVEPASH